MRATGLNKARQLTGHFGLGSGAIEKTGKQLDGTRHCASATNSKERLSAQNEAGDTLSRVGSWKADNATLSLIERPEFNL